MWMKITRAEREIRLNPNYREPAEEEYLCREFDADFEDRDEGAYDEDMDEEAD